MAILPHGLPSGAPRERAARLVDALFVDAAETDRDGGFPSHSIDLLRDAGLLAAPLADAFGGESLGAASRTHELLCTLAAIGRGSLVAGRLYEGHVNALQLIERHGNPEQRARWAGDATAGQLFGVWNTEADGGVRLVGTTRGYRLAGSKTFASGLGHVGRALVTAACETEAGRGWQMVIVDTESRRPREDRSFWRPLGMRASASFRADFEGIEVAADDLLGAPGAYYGQPAFSGGAIRFAAVQQGGAEAVFDETRRFLGALGRTDDPHQRARLGEMAWQIESGRLWLDGAARNADSAMSSDGAADAAGAVGYANLMRSAVESIALRVLALSERCVGARGLLRPEPFERLHRDLTHYLRQPAPDAAVVDAGRHVLADPRPASALWS